MICTTALIIINMAAAQMSDVHRETSCLPEKTIVNFLAVQADKRRAVQARKIRNQKIKGNG
jgi:hypothetical protein